MRRIRAVRAGVVYFAVVFAVGFALGALRTLVVEPWIGATAAVALETPFMLLASWIACGRVVRRFAVPSVFVARLTMGGVALGLLLLAEAALAAALGRGVTVWVRDLGTAPGLLGLAAQVVFGAIPAIRAWERRW